MDGEPQRAFALLDELRSTYGARDHDGWLDRTIRGNKAFILSQNGRHEEALAILEGLSAELAPGSDEHLSNQAAIAIDLESLGRFREALDALERGLSVASGQYVMSALDLFAVYLRIADQMQVPVPLSYRSVFDEAVRAWGIEVPETLFAPDSIRAAVAFATKAHREASRRHARLQRALAHAAENERVRLIEEYVTTEPVGFYRKLARGEMEGDES